MTDVRIFLGLPVDFEGLCEIYPPTVGEVFSFKDFQKFKMVLTISQEDIEDQFFENQEIDPKVTIPTPYEYIIQNSKHNKNFKKLVEEAIGYFTHTKANIVLEEEIIILGDLQDLLSLTDIGTLPIIDKDNFFAFQNMIRSCVGEEQKKSYVIEQNIRLRKMKAKARYRDRVKAKKGGMTLEDSLTSICCMGIGINPLNIREISYAAMKKLILKFQQKERYDTDIRSLIAGADSKKVKPQYWMNKLQDK